MFRSRTARPAAVRFGAACLAVALVFTALPAEADTLASKYATLVAEIDTRLAAIPASHPSKLQKKQKSALTKAAVVMNHDAADVAGTLADTKKLVSGLDKTFPADATLGPLLDQPVTDVHDVALAALNLVSLRDQGVPSNVASKAKIEALIAKAGVSFAAYDTATARTPRLAAVKSALKSVSKASAALDKVLGPGGGDVTTTAFDVSVDGVNFHLPNDSGQTNYTVIYSSPGAGSLNVVASGPEGASRDNISLTVMSPGLGDRDIQATSNFTRTPGGPMNLTAVSGTMHISSWDPAGHKVAGTFTVTYSNGAMTVTLTGGTFSTTNMLTP
jgi:hypothetical protein